MGTERHVVTALCLLSELFEEALARDLDLDDIDLDVVIDQTDDAGRHVTGALFLLRPDIGRLRPEKRVDALDRLFARHVPERACLCNSYPEHMENLASDAWNELATCLESRDPRVREQADYAMSHLDVVLLLIDPDRYSRAIDCASPADRVKLAAQAEASELMLEEARELVKEAEYG
jgi:hypothetical protein